ncbi:uncharacterized protein EV420DRAFT_1486202 [Desarmillaria tabescens]|uniref:Uncharacterized protein n=1 Tax=Armillaria tabescens TaxID=1929756 RepID=A0AA39JFM3_ARMTA|nr:uncharacterized protein EV420DRAFT_1486202 [Desarmillaria tabescens]KAK0439678.1 hypothetical protein EV420DRAFT_1486202 [Desarmillaria tabescens]
MTQTQTQSELEAVQAVERKTRPEPNSGPTDAYIPTVDEMTQASAVKKSPPGTVTSGKKPFIVIWRSETGHNSKLEERNFCQTFCPMFDDESRPVTYTRVSLGWILLPLTIPASPIVPASEMEDRLHVGTLPPFRGTGRKSLTIGVGIDRTFSTDVSTRFQVVKKPDVLSMCRGVRDYVRVPGTLDETRMETLGASNMRISSSEKCYEFIDFTPQSSSPAWLQVTTVIVNLRTSDITLVTGTTGSYGSKLPTWRIKEARHVYHLYKAPLQVREHCHVSGGDRLTYLPQKHKYMRSKYATNSLTKAAAQDRDIRSHAILLGYIYTEPTPLPRARPSSTSASK